MPHFGTRFAVNVMAALVVADTALLCGSFAATRSGGAKLLAILQLVVLVASHVTLLISLMETRLFRGGYYYSLLSRLAPTLLSGLVYLGLSVGSLVQLMDEQETDVFYWNAAVHAVWAMQRIAAAVNAFFFLQSLRWLSHDDTFPP
eukprot:m.36312 g.36312  ORF g.36312 m.36312 type:complete len:146 (-) comp13401_c0_seq1:42-479(-)